MLLPSSGRDSHVTLRNHTIAVGQAVRVAAPPTKATRSPEAPAELGIDVGYVRKAKPRKEHGSGPRETTRAISVVVAAVGPRGERPRVWASARPRTTKLREEMTEFLARSGYVEKTFVQVITDAARDLADVADKLPHDSRWMLDWNHIARKLRMVDQSITPLAYGRLTPTGSAFELWDLFVRFRNYVWTGQTAKWKKSGEQLLALLELREKVDTEGLEGQARLSQSRLLDVLGYLQSNSDSLVDYRRYQQLGRRISTGFVESSINRLVGRRMCKGQHMRCSTDGADGVVQVRAALQNNEFDAFARQQFSWSGSRHGHEVWITLLRRSHPPRAHAPRTALGGLG